jgi:hypothetical protein
VHEESVFEKELSECKERLNAIFDTQVSQMKKQLESISDQLKEFETKLKIDKELIKENIYEFIEKYLTDE